MRGVGVQLPAPNQYCPPPLTLLSAPIRGSKTAMPMPESAKAISRPAPNPAGREISGSSLRGLDMDHHPKFSVLGGVETRSRRPIAPAPTR